MDSVEPQPESPNSNGKPKWEDIHLSIQGVKRVYVFKPRGSISPKDAVAAFQFLLFPVYKMPPPVLDLVWEKQLGDSTKKHFVVKEKSAILVPGRG